MSKSLAPAVIAVALLWVAFGRPLQPAPAPAPSPAPAPVRPEDPLKAAFDSIAPADREIIGNLYEALADAVERDTSVVTSTAVLADGIGRSIDLAFAGRTVSDGTLGELIDAHIAGYLGFEKGKILDIVITSANRPTVVSALRSVAAKARQK